MAHQQAEDPSVGRQGDFNQDEPDQGNESQGNNGEEEDDSVERARRRTFSPFILFQFPLGGLEERHMTGGYDALTSLMLGATFYTTAVPTNGSPSRFFAFILPPNFRRQAPRLSRTYLEGLQERPLTKEQRHECEDCSICLETVDIGSHVITLPCNHFFHPPCVRTWLESRHTCPVCRYEMQTDDADFEPGRVQRMEQRAREETEARERLRKSMEEKEQKANNEKGAARAPGAESVNDDDGEGLELPTRKRKMSDIEGVRRRSKRARTEPSQGEGQGEREAAESNVVAGARRSRRAARRRELGPI